MNILAGKSIVVTGGSGSFGHAFVRRVLSTTHGPARVCILSRDEYKQGVMRQEFRDDPRLRWFLGDVRDLERLQSAFHGADLVVHAAAMKQVPACEYNAFECIATNVTGSQNVVKAAVACEVRRVIALSTDKAVQPCTTYGASKLMMERVIVNGNALSGGKLMMSCTRYGNVQDSRLSVLPVWRRQMERGEPLTITDPGATRFHMTQDEAVDLVLLAAAQMRGGEVFIPKLPAYRLGDLADALVTNRFAGTGGKIGQPEDIARVIVGLRVGEKKHESLISPDEVARDFGDHLRVLPALHPWRNGGEEVGGEAMPEGWTYRSDTVRRLTVEALRDMGLERAA